MSSVTGSSSVSKRTGTSNSNPARIMIPAVGAKHHGPHTRLDGLTFREYFKGSQKHQTPNRLNV